jgi:hypothetical protein
MKVFIAVLKELFGLFVDDSSFALAILFWLAVSLTFHMHTGIWVGGLIIMLVENIHRSARRGK